MKTIYPLSNLKTRFCTLLSLLSVTICVFAQVDSVNVVERQYKIVELKTDTLPGLNIARAGHEALCLDGQLTVFGGHTDGFIPTATAEYYRDGKWHSVPLVYPHDHATVIPLRSGKVFMAGGHKEPLGIGQIYSAELYDPITNTSQGFGSLNRKRAFANALEMEDGQVIVSGNWHEEDGVSVFSNVYDPTCTNAVEVKDVSFARAKPYILRVSDDDAIIFGSLSNTNGPVDYSVVDCLKGQTYNEPFLNTWTPIRTLVVQRNLNQFIGDESKGYYHWLLPVENDETNQVAIAQVQGLTKNNPKPVFSLFQTQEPLPKTIDGKRVIYSSLICDPERKLAYLIGNDEDYRMYVVAFSYDTPQPVPLTIFKTEPQLIQALSITPMLTPEGDLVFAGGRQINNFTVSNSVTRLPLSKYFGSKDEDLSSEVEASNESISWLKIIIPSVIALIIVLAIVIYFIVKRRTASNHKTIAHPFGNPEECKDGNNEVSNNVVGNNEDGNREVGNSVNEDLDELDNDDVENEETETEEDLSMEKNLPKDEILSDLYKRISKLMEEEQLYLNPNLRASDIAERVNSNTAYVSGAINSQCRCSFTQFLAGYRIAFAQKLMLADPNSKISHISALSGFTTDSTFFRAFRSVTGMSPKEWLAANVENPQT